MQYQFNLIHGSPWRTLWIMDAMRYDVFQEIVKEENIGHMLIPAYSNGCETGMWIGTTWTKKYLDTVLISNSMIYWKPEYRGIHLKKFYRTIDLWRGREKPAMHGGRFLSTKEVIDEAEKQSVINSDKRLLIHDIPPHLPFVDEEGKRFMDSFAVKDDMVYKVIYWGKKNGWSKLRHYYKESARLTLKTIIESKWLCERDLVITADHGELIGEGNVYGHSLNYKTHPALRVVPWMVVK